MPDTPATPAVPRLLRPVVERIHRWPIGSERPLWWRLAAAVAAVPPAILLRLALLAPTDPSAPYASFIAAVAVAAFLGGWVSATGAAALSVVVVAGWITPGPFDTHDWFALALFLLTALLITALTGLLHRAIVSLRTENIARHRLERELRQAHADLERLVRERTADLAASNALLDETGRIARVGGWTQDLRTSEVGWTLAARQIHEVGPEFRPDAAALTSFYESEVRASVAAALERARTEGVAFDLELPFVTAGHIPLWVRTTGQAYREDGRIVRIGGVVQDITIRRRAEDELRQQRDQLEQLVAERTAANARLRELDRLKSEFLSTMSHELRTPLNSIIGFTGILLKGLPGPLNPEQHKQLGLVQSSARHLLALITDLLDLARIDSGRIELHHEPFDFATLVEEVATFLLPVAGEKGLALRHECAPAALQIRSDRRRCRQILLNLATNAVKFTERGEVAILAHLESGRLVVAVRDTGIGIRADQLPQLFEPLRQLDASAHRNYEGTGLGLHLAKRLLDVLGGTIAVESTPGAGSTFTFTLPVASP